MGEFAHEAAHFLNLSQTLPWCVGTPHGLANGLLHRLDFVGHDQR
jgi:hypothetical protein